MADLTKKAYQKTQFSNQQLLEFSKCATDPFYFLNNYFKIQHPTRGSMLYDAYEFQKDYFILIMIIDFLFLCLVDKWVNLQLRQDTCFGMQCLTLTKLF